MMKIKIIMRLLPLAGLLWGVLALPQTAMALGTDDVWDSPHDAANSMDCGSCHQLRGATYPNMVNMMCQSCHYVGGPVRAAYIVQTHSSTTTDDDYGNWDLDCWSCHNPHTQGNASYGKLVKTDFNTISGPTIVKEINPAGGQDDGLGNLYYPPIDTIRSITSDMVEFTDSTGFVDNDGETEDDICQVCHALTSNYSSGAVDSHGNYGSDSQPGGNCTSCHLHTGGFAAAGGSCLSCHSSTKGSGNNRRQVTDTGGDFVRNRHHVTDGSTTEIVTEADCQVCHNQDNHQSNTDPQVVLNDGDIGVGTTYTYDGTGASVETFCLKCHDADGSLAYDPDGNSGDGYQPFSDGYDPTDINTDWTGAAHNSTVKSSLATEGCLTCHGGSDSTVTETVTDHNVHGSTNENMLSARIDSTLILNLEEDICFTCHDGSYTGTPDIRSTMSTLRPSGHSITSYSGIHTATEDEGTMADHVECLDCHNPHAANNTAKTASPLTPAEKAAGIGISGMMVGVPGIDASGAEVAATEEYQVCLRCHGDNAVTVSTEPRLVDNSNLRLRFASGNPSQHGVIVPGASSNVPSLTNGWTVGDVVYCTDCHLDSVNASMGVHGSDNPYLLKLNYNTGTYPVTESATEYALCYSCHFRGTYGDTSSSGITDDASWPGHDKHLSKDISCSTCHDPHGIALADAGGAAGSGTHLINLRSDIADKDGKPANSGTFVFTDLGNQSGWCATTCHDKQHDASNKDY